MPTESDRILIVAETEKGQVLSATLGLINAGRKLAQNGGEMVSVCVMGHHIADALSEIAYYADEVYAIDHPLLVDFQVDLYASALEALCRAIKPSTILLGHSYDNFELAPKIACAMERELITDCIGVERDVDTKQILCSKQVYGGNAVVVFELDNTSGIVTIRPKVYDAAEKNQTTGRIIPFLCELDPSCVLTESIRIESEQSVSLDTAEVIVAGGRGIGTKERIEDLEKLIEALRRHFERVELGASRPLIDEGILPRSRQIGQTGERASPQIYVAVAISGATQHVSGMIGSKKIIAINKNEGAPIFDVADYGVVGRFEDVIPSLIQQLGELS